MGRDVYVSVLFIINCLGLVYVLFVRYVLLFMHFIHVFHFGVLEKDPA